MNETENRKLFYELDDISRMYWVYYEDETLKVVANLVDKEFIYNNKLRNVKDIKSNIYAKSLDVNDDKVYNIIYSNGFYGVMHCTINNRYFCAYMQNYTQCFLYENLDFIDEL